MTNVSAAVLPCDKIFEAPQWKRFNRLRCTHNAEKTYLIDEIRVSEKATMEVLIGKFVAKMKSSPLPYHENPDFLPSLFTNNVELASALYCSPKTVYNHLSKLSNIELPNQMGMLLVKTNRGVKQNYQVRMNPYILCGQVVENWGKLAESPVEKVVLSEENSQNQNLKNAQISLNTHLMRKNLPLFLRTKNYITTTSGVEKRNVDGTSFVPQFLYKNNTSTQTSTYKQEQGLDSCQQKLVLTHEKDTNTTPQTNTTYVVSTPINGSVQTSSNTIAPNTTQTALKNTQHKGGAASKNVDNTVENATNLPVSELEFVKSLVESFWQYAFRALYASYSFQEAHEKKILNLIYQNWFREYMNLGHTQRWWQSYTDKLMEAVNYESILLQKNPSSFRHPDPKRYFDFTFQHGFKRACAKLIQAERNKDARLLVAAKKSIREMKAPRSVKEFNNKPFTISQLITYWQYRISQKSMFPTENTHHFKIWLSNPKNYMPKLKINLSKL